MKSGNLNFLEPSGPLQACNGTALPFIVENTINTLSTVLEKHGISQCESRWYIKMPLCSDRLTRAKETLIVCGLYIVLSVIFIY